MGKDQWFSNAHIYHFNVDSLAYTIGLAGFNIFSNCIREEEMGSKIYVGFKIKKWMTLNQLIPLSTKTLEDIKDIIVTGNELYYKREALLRERYEQLRESDRREENRCQD
jgi:hypothetical protein